MNYHWNWAIFFDPAPDSSVTYLQMILAGAATTCAVAAISALIAVVTGIPLGIAARQNGIFGSAARAYVEIFRNIPLLAQMFLWYFVLPEFLPRGLQLLVKQSPEAPLVLGMLSLGFYSAARICEQVRAALNAIPSGQWQAARALGLRPVQTYRYVLLPRAFRLVIPTITSEFISIVKNSAVVLTIGVMELTASARAMQEYSFQVFEAFIVATFIYLTINLIIVAVMSAVELFTRTGADTRGGARGRP
ncbi:amino acid ABC transporter permease [Chelatococcus asaccharovorans]|uniref:amino acid ABC transporter permease n=1 Tax=Chelatococcus asaccharovorans TaxID=28210 RepID=UPI00224C731D|nr:amino acid ABC transporter permease [Chelatococcus asaccharovorans]CAH1667451.1 glutamate/aspartate ABC transporter membrane subunit GltJ [Chelatococcus asaccharovorans]CAH1680937.1 glutamate/aspartate ABC transporter membrane subunit GltJ [Chelatococcus asaccharovorans]